MRKKLLLMSALLRRPLPGVTALVPNYLPSYTTGQHIKYVTRNNHHSLHTPTIISPSLICTATQWGRYNPSKTSLHLLSKDFSTNPNGGGRGSAKKVERELSNAQEEAHEAEFLQPNFKRGDRVMAEVIYFGPLGASVDIVAHNSHDSSNCIPQDEPALGRGMILQREINYFRRGRGDVDVVKLEVLPAYVEKIREITSEEGDVEVRLDISLRPPGGKAKAEDLGEQILQKLKDNDGLLDIGDKSSPVEINEVFPGASKIAFKKAVSGLYRRGLVSPGPKSISLM